MNCGKIRALIDESPAAEWTRTERESVEAHVAGCEACATALSAARTVDARLRELPRLRAPAGLAAAIAARAQDERRRKAAGASQNHPKRDRESLWNHCAWSAVLLGGSIAVSVQVFRLLSGGWRSELMAPVGELTVSLTEIDMANPIVYIAACAVVVYLMGLFGVRGAKS